VKLLLKPVLAPGLTVSEHCMAQAISVPSARLVMLKFTFAPSVIDVSVWLFRYAPVPLWNRLQLSIPVASVAVKIMVRLVL